MRLLTHNFLQSNVKGTTKGYPLIIEAEHIVVEEENESPVDREFLIKMLSKLNYSVLVSAAQQLKAQSKGEEQDNIPEIPPEEPEVNDIQGDLLENLHKVVFNVHVLQGHLVCPDTGRKFPVKDGIPNMILHEDEI